MSTGSSSWKRIARRTIYDTPFLKLYSDDVALPSGTIVSDYSIVELPTSVTIVATDEAGRLIMFNEYKYATDTRVLTLPAGAIDGDETPVEAAQRELLEETGYIADDVEYVAELQVYPSKFIYKNHVVRLKHARLKSETKHEKAEQIGKAQLFTIEEVRRAVDDGSLYLTSSLSAIMLTLGQDIFR